MILSRSRIKKGNNKTDFLVITYLFDQLGVDISNTLVPLHVFKKSSFIHGSSSGFTAYKNKSNPVSWLEPF